MLFSIFFMPFCLLSQALEEDFGCAYDEVHQTLLEDNPAYREKIKENQEKYVQYARIRPLLQLSGLIHTLPTVVHIVHEGAPLGSDANPTNATISTVLQEATDRFRHTSGLTFTNPNSGIDTEIEFCLATTDPSGNYTTGVIRYYEPNLSVGPYTNLSSLISSTKWDISKYNNMYIMTKMTNASGVYLGGTDVTVYDAGTFWSGLVCHELGHYLSLAHIFQGGCNNVDCLNNGDGVCDTPPKSQPGTLGATCANPSNSCSSDDDDLSTNNPYRPVANGGLGDQPDMLENYMDYTGGCWNAFSQGQSARMRFNIENSRTVLTNHASTACASRPKPANEIGVIDFKVISNPCSAGATIEKVTVANYGMASLTNCIIEVLVNEVLVHSISQSVSVPTSGNGTISSSNITINAAITLSEGNNIIQVRTRQPNGQIDGFSNNDWAMKTLFYTSQGIIPPYTEEFSSSSNWPIGYEAINGNHLAWMLGLSNATRKACFGDYFAYTLGRAPSPETAILRLPIANLLNLADASLSFKYGYIQRYSYIEDTLSVRITTNCTNSQIVWTKSDLALSTGGFSDGVYVFPGCSHDEVVTIDLSSFVGEEDLLIEFVAGGRYYSGLVLDSISITSSTATCGIPSNLANSNITDNSVTASWNVTNTANSYQLQYKPSSSNTWQTINNLTTSSYIISGLAPNTSYDLRVRSQCSGDLTSDWLISDFTTFATYCPDLVITDVQVTSFSSSSIQYTYTIKNVGTAPANLDGPTNSNGDNVKILAFLSSDMLFNNAGDIAAGGTVLGLSPVGDLESGNSRTGSFGAGAVVNTATHPYLILKIDWEESLVECDETNNIYAVMIEPSTDYSDYIGHWQHEDLDTHDIPVTIIREASNQLFVHTFGRCSPTYCDWGEQATPISDGQDGKLIVQWNPGFAIMYDTLVLLDQTTMRRMIHTTYIDNSGRADQHFTFLMYKNDCVNHLDISLLTGNPMVYWSANNLTSNGSVEPGQTITLKGGVSVQLLPGFHAKTNSTFSAVIAACSLSSIRREEPNVAKKEVIVSNTTAISESVQLQVHPNPLLNQATVRFYLPTAGVAKVLVFDINGQLLTEQVSESGEGWNSTQLDASRLPAGMYYVTLQTQNGRWTEKIMVTR